MKKVLQVSFLVSVLLTQSTDIFGAAAHQVMDTLESLSAREYPLSQSKDLKGRLMDLSPIASYFVQKTNLVETIAGQILSVPAADKVFDEQLQLCRSTLKNQEVHEATIALLSLVQHGGDQKERILRVIFEGHKQAQKDIDSLMLLTQLKHSGLQ